MRRRINPLIEQWQRICILAERIIKRREAAAVRPFVRRAYNPAHLVLPLLSSRSDTASLMSSRSIASQRSVMNQSFMSQSRYSDPSQSMSQSMLGSAFGFGNVVDDDQSDLSRLTNTLRAVVEVNDPCWRGDECELSAGVRLGLGHVAAHCQRHSEISELRVSTIRGFK